MLECTNARMHECTNARMSESRWRPHLCIVHATNRVKARPPSAGSEASFASAARNTHGTDVLGLTRNPGGNAGYSLAREALPRYSHYAADRPDVCGGKVSCRICERLNESGIRPQVRGFRETLPGLGFQDGVRTEL